MELTSEIVFALLQSSDPFPVNFDDAMQWWDCRTKNGTPVRRDNLVAKLKTNFYENVDYHLLKNQEPLQGEGSSPYIYFLTIECFKMMGMMHSGPRGREIRQYFINCETELKRRIEQDKVQNRQRIVEVFVSSKFAPWKPRFEKEFFEHIYRLKGWKQPVSGHPPCMAQAVNNTVYDWFPDGVPEKLREVNPRQENGRRKRKHHQHLQDTGSVFLDTQKTIALTVMRLSPDSDWKRFEANMQQAAGDTVQIELPFMQDEESV
jgi:phage anti-repressor protein